MSRRSVIPACPRARLVDCTKRTSAPASPAQYLPLLRLPEPLLSRPGLETWALAVLERTNSLRRQHPDESAIDRRRVKCLRGRRPSAAWIHDREFHVHLESLVCDPDRRRLIGIQLKTFTDPTSRDGSMLGSAIRAQSMKRFLGTSAFWPGCISPHALPYTPRVGTQTAAGRTLTRTPEGPSQPLSRRSLPTRCVRRREGGG